MLDSMPIERNKFLTPLCSIPVRLKNRGLSRWYKKWIWVRELTADLVYVDENGIITTIPKGFRTDGGSIPKVLRFSLTPFAPHMAEQFILHDFDYRSHIHSRKKADERLYVSSEGRINIVKRKAIYRSVRMFGGSAYKARGKDRYED